ncbi:hypothetical protein WJX84_007413 [Apatococcus fuscideae]|uniref:BZIP domain-containing protein n=1 Tax=Apatococcus fuscideae TaxID=2026836 RepID=A0AAW1T4W9_9CHLO
MNETLQSGLPQTLEVSFVARQQKALATISPAEADSQDPVSPQRMDPSEQQRRRGLSRKASQAYRQRKKARYSKLQQKIQDLESRLDSLQADRPLQQYEKLHSIEQTRESRAVEVRGEGFHRGQQARTNLLRPSSGRCPTRSLTMDARTSKSRTEQHLPISGSMSVMPPTDPQTGARQDCIGAHASREPQYLAGGTHGPENEAASVNPALMFEDQAAGGKGQMQTLVHLGQERGVDMLAQEKWQQHLQGLVPHPSWAAATPLPLAQLYMALGKGHTALEIPLPNMHPNKPVTMSQLATMSLADFAAFTAPYQAYLAYTSPFVRDPRTEMGKCFAATAAEALSRQTAAAAQLDMYQGLDWVDRCPNPFSVCPRSCGVIPLPACLGRDYLLYCYFLISPWHFATHCAWETIFLLKAEPAGTKMV